MSKIKRNQSNLFPPRELHFRNRSSTMYKKVAVLLLGACLVLGTSGQKLSDAEARSRLTQAGISVYSSGGCSDRYNPTCTSLEQVRETSIAGIITLKTASGCDIVVTGGTEVGHADGEYSHWNGYKLDTRLTTCIDNYVYTHFEYIGDRVDGTPLYEARSGNIYARESNHWDILYYNDGNKAKKSVK